MDVDVHVRRFKTERKVAMMNKNKDDHDNDHADEEEQYIDGHKDDWNFDRKKYNCNLSWLWLVTATQDEEVEQHDDDDDHDWDGQNMIMTAFWRFPKTALHISNISNITQSFVSSNLFYAAFYQNFSNIL